MPFSVSPKLLEGVNRDVDLSEMRQVSTLFMNCQGVHLAATPDGDCEAAMERGHALMYRAQEEVHYREGQARRRPATAARRARTRTPSAQSLDTRPPRRAGE